MPQWNIAWMERVEAIMLSQWGNASLAELARRARLPDSTLRHYSDGASMPTLVVASHITRVLGRDHLADVWPMALMLGRPLPPQPASPPPPPIHYSATSRKPWHVVFAKRMEMLMAYYNLSSWRHAARYGSIHPPALRQYRLGRATPQLMVAVRMANSFGYSVPTQLFPVDLMLRK